MDSWYDEMVAAEYARHDETCELGANCHLRTAEVMGAYVPAAMMARIDSLESPTPREVTVAFAIADMFKRNGTQTPPIYIGPPSEVQRPE